VGEKLNSKIIEKKRKNRENKKIRVDKRTSLFYQDKILVNAVKQCLHCHLSHEERLEHV